MNKNTTFDPARAVYTPPEASNYAKQQIEKMRDSTHRAVKFPVGEIDDYFADMLPGQLCAIIAQTSNYKSGFLHFWEHTLARQLMDQGRDDEVIIHVSVEEAVEEQIYLMLGAATGEDAGDLARGEVQDWDRLEQASIKVGTVPIYRVGDSLARADDFPNLYLSNIIRAIKFLAGRDESGGLLGRELTIAAIFVDYLQALPIDPEVRGERKNDQRRLQVRSDIYRSRYMAAFFDCPVILGVQAKQALTGAPGPNMLIPGIYDGEESSSIAQRVDRGVQLWMPKTTHQIGDDLTHKNVSFLVEENLLWVKVGKQRGRLPAGRSWRCRIDFTHNRIATENLPGYDPFANEEYS